MNTYQQNYRAKTKQSKHRTLSNFALSFHPSGGERDGDSRITSRYAPNIVRSRSGSKEGSKHGGSKQQQRRQKNFSTIG